MVTGCVCRVVGSNLDGESFRSIRKTVERREETLTSSSRFLLSKLDYYCYKYEVTSWIDMS